ncbi:amino acid deaminase [Microlunatus aurantiacus]|uniref:Amino acid deaminase n=1 Tax=Microlunatus aurantiacus TaxID=446786 RepID=A0ABP7CRB6_9ACTN
MPEPDPAVLDAAALAVSDAQPLTWADKGVPPELWGRTPAQVVAQRVPLSEFPTPLLTLAAPALRQNVATLARWCAERGLDLAPHGKTTMAPRLWADQLAAGAWAITLANLPQLAVARAFGVSRVLIANAIISPLSLRWIADQLAADPRAQVITWADDVATVALMEEALASYAPSSDDGYRPLDVLVELGGPGGRTGARDLAAAVDVARAVAEAPHLRLAGVGGYEAALAADSDPASLTAVRGFLTGVRRVHERIDAEGWYPTGLVPVVTAGGSAYFDDVAEVLGPLTAEGVRVVLRSGAYLTHDDGHYRHLSPLGEHPRTPGPGLVSALHGWVRVSSQPEPGLALVDGGKRDLPYDLGLPEVQLRRPRDAGEAPQRLTGLSITALNDQHGFLRWDPALPAPVRIGDELRLGVSHPCTAFDKWQLIPVIDDADAADPVVVDLIRTYF